MSDRGDLSAAGIFRGFESFMTDLRVFG